MAGTEIQIVVGLGNPGPEHALTRHNAGFWFVDALALDLRWNADVPRRTRSERAPDLCGTVRPDRPAYGAFEEIARCVGAAPR